MADAGLRALILLVTWVFVSSVAAFLATGAWRAYAGDPLRRALALAAIVSGTLLLLLLATGWAVTPPRQQFQPPIMPAAPGQPGQPPGRPGGPVPLPSQLP